MPDHVSEEIFPDIFMRVIGLSFLEGGHCTLGTPYLPTGNLDVPSYLVVLEGLQPGSEYRIQ